MNSHESFGSGDEVSASASESEGSLVDSSPVESEVSIPEAAAESVAVPADAETHKPAEVHAEKNVWGKIVDGARYLYAQAKNLLPGQSKEVMERAKGYEKKALVVNEVMRVSAAERIKDFRQKIDRQAYGTIQDDQLDLLKQELKNTQDYLFSGEAVLKAGGSYEKLVDHRNYLENMVRVIDVRMNKPQVTAPAAQEAGDQRMAA